MEYSFVKDRFVGITIFIVLLLAFAFKVEGKIIVVDSSGNGDYEDLQKAINECSEGDKIVVMAGEYGSVVINKSISMEGENATLYGIEINANNVSISGFIIKDGYYAIDIAGNNNVIENCTIFNNSHGINIKGDGNKIIHNKIFRNSYEGINLDYADDNEIKGNEIYRNAWGIYMEKSNNNIIYMNIIKNNHEGIVIQGGKGNIVRMNNITGNEYKGIHLCCKSEKNHIFNNNFIGNKNNAYCYGGINYWDNDGVGNYWDDYDGKGEYEISSGNVDEFPAEKPFAINISHSYRIYILSPQPGEKIKGKIVVRGIAEKEAKVEIKIDDGEWKKASGTLLWYAEIDTTELPNGEHTIYARCGNATTSCTIYVENEKGMPSFTFIAFFAAFIIIFLSHKRFK